MWAEIANIVGLIGVFLILLAYFLLHTGKMKVQGAGYLWMNLIGSCMILFSLFFAWNLPALVIEVTWISISLHGLYKLTLARNKKVNKSLAVK